MYQNAVVPTMYAPDHLVDPLRLVRLDQDVADRGGDERPALVGPRAVEQWLHFERELTSSEGEKFGQHDVGANPVIGLQHETPTLGSPRIVERRAMGVAEILEVHVDRAGRRQLHQFRPPYGQAGEGEAA